MKPDIRTLCLAKIAEGNAIGERNRPAHFSWSVSEELNYWRARAMVAEEALQQCQAYIDNCAHIELVRGGPESPQWPVIEREAIT